MRIADSQMMMGAGRRFVQQAAGGVMNSAFHAGLTRYAAGRRESAGDTEGEVLGARRTGGAVIQPALYGSTVANRPEEATGTDETKESPVTAETEEAGETTDAGANGNALLGIRESLLQEILRRMMSAGMFGGLSAPFGGFGSFTGFGGMGFGMPAMQFDRSGMTYTQLNYGEEERTSFFSQGFAKTEDGRVIDFDLRLEMSRAFLDYSQIRIPMLSNVLCDPLVINVDNACANLSDQTFRFDLDGDGEEDDISYLNKGSGFLALDRNEDGVINDGSELFGVKSGNGFEDLREFDSDGNGWIDENDEVYAKLKVWYKNGEGEEELVDLKTADVGAIFLGHEQTDFSLYGEQMKMNGMIRATGMFLRESGGAGTVQHLDMALQNGQVQALPGTEGVDPALQGKIYDVSLADGKGGALVIETAGTGTGQQEEAVQTKQGESGKEEEKRTESNKDTRAEEAARRKEQYDKRVAEAARRKALTEKYYARKQLRKEQLEKLFEERMEEREAMNEALYEEAIAERAEEQQLLNNALKHEEAMEEMVEEQMAAVA
ncbi:MAG: hypothetical protein IJR00_10265 [Lachnospiraceae bacterium]|nr:hypothetical protein [Lachnospiraceae bacterium]